MFNQVLHFVLAAAAVSVAAGLTARLIAAAKLAKVTLTTEQELQLQRTVAAAVDYAEQIVETNVKLGVQKLETKGGAKLAQAYNYLRGRFPRLEADFYKLIHAELGSRR